MAFVEFAYKTTIIEMYGYDKKEFHLKILMPVKP